MCGIAGFFGPPRRRDDAITIAREMLGLIQHRGPDEQGYYVDTRLGLASARLAIIDVPTGQQPLADEGERFWIAYNGEIYNYVELRAELESLGHRFHTRSDTEVVLEAWKAWGAEAPARFNGGFAFAIYDRVERSLALARDRWGKRPLYHARVDKTLLFASEIKAFLAYPGMQFRWDPQRLRSLFALWTPLPDESPFEGVDQVLPGTCLLVSAGGARTVAYPAMPSTDTVAMAQSADPPSTARALLSNSVRLRLRSDVPVGTYLSGGLDSAIVTRLAVEQSRHTVRTFSVTFDEADFDESGDQAGVSRYLGTEHRSLLVHAGDISDAFPDAVWFAEIPVFRSAFVPMFLLSRSVRDAGLKVVLTGEGADEVFLGYDIFKEATLRRRWPDLTAEQRVAELAGLYGYERHFRPANAAALAAVFAEHSQQPEAPLFSHALRLANSRLAVRLLGDGSPAEPALIAWLDRRAPDFASRDLLARAQSLEFVTLLAGYLLSTQGDRMALAHGVENRCPFLDPQLAAWASSLGPDVLFPAGVMEKAVLRRAFDGALPPAVLLKRKRPYRAPDAAAFLDGRPDYLDDALSDRALADVGVVDVSFASRFLGRIRTLPPARVSPRESQALMLLLSLSIMDRYFVQRRYPVSAPLARLVRAHDGSRAAGAS